MSHSSLMAATTHRPVQVVLVIVVVVLRVAIVVAKLTATNKSSA